MLQSENYKIFLRGLDYNSIYYQNNTTGFSAK